MTHTRVRIHLVTAAGAGTPRGAELPTLETRPRAQAREAVEVSSVTTRTEADGFVVTLAGDVGLVPAGDLARALARAEEHCVRHVRAHVHLDVRAVTALDPSALRLLERLRRTCSARGANCTTSTARPAVQQVLALARPVVDGEPAAS